MFSIQNSAAEVLCSDEHVSAPHLHRMLSLSPAVLYSCGAPPDYPTTFISHNVLDQLGYAPSEFHNDPFFWTKLIHPADRQRVLSELARLEQVEQITYEYRVRHHAGHYCWLHDEVSAVRDAAGAVSMLIGCWIDITELKRSRAQQEGEHRVLARLAGGSSLQEALEELVRTIEDRAPGMLCSVLVYDHRGRCLRHGAAPSLPDEYNRVIDGFEIGPEAGSCGTAAYRRRRVIVEDIQSDPLWVRYRDLAQQHNLRACWSQPIMLGADRLLGTFAMYYRHPRGPTQPELELIEIAADLAALAIQKKRADDALRASEAKYQDLYDNAPDMFASYDAETGLIVECNDTLAQATGFERSELVGRRIFELYDPACEAAVIRAHKQFVLTGCIRDVELRLRCKRGRVFDVSLSASAVRDDQGRIRYSRAIWRNITQRKLAEQAINERTRLIEFSADVRIAFGQKRTLEDVLHDCAQAMVRRLDAAFARIWTLNRMENVLELVASAGLYTHTTGVHGRIAVGQLKIGRIAKERKPLLTNDLSSDPFIDHDWARREGLTAFAGYPLIVEEELVGVMAMFARAPLSETILQAMSTVADTIALGIDRKNAEEVLHRAERLASIGTLAAGIAHEVNNPITAIMIAAQMTLKENEGGPFPESLRTCLEGIIRDAGRCERIVAGVLQFARSGTTEKAPMDLHETIGHAVEMTAAYARQKGATLDVRLALHKLRVDANPGQIEQVLVILIRNAVEAGGVGNRVEISTQPGPRTALIRVADHGSGMTVDQQKRIFDPFYTTRSSEGGTGLGLSIAHGIVRGHGGRIEVRSRPGHGTVLTVALPLLPDQGGKSDYGTGGAPEGCR